MLSAQRVGPIERDGGDQQRWPDETFTLLQFVRAPGHREHRNDRCQIGQSRQPAGLDHVHLLTLFENRRQPQHKAIHPDAPAEKLQGQQDDFRRAEGCRVVFYGLHADLFGIQRALQVLFLLLAEPFGVAWAVIRQTPPDKRPHHGRQAFDNKHPAPAVMLNQVARDHRHPKHGHRVAENQEGVGARAFGTGEPMTQVHQHGGHDGGFNHPEHEANHDQAVGVGHHARERGQAAPEDQADKDQLFNAIALRVDRPGDLEEEIPEKEQCAQQ